MCSLAGTYSPRVQYSPNGWCVLSAARVFTPSPTALSQYQLGADNSNTCPSGANRITDAVACAAAAASQGKPFSGSETVTNYPKGCYVWTSGGSDMVYLNRDASGGATASAKLLCAVGACGPAPAARTYACANAHARTHTRAFARATRVCEWAHAH